MQILESSVTTKYSDGSGKTRKIEGEIRTDGKKDFSPIGRRHIDIKPGTQLRNFTSSEFQEFCEYHNYKLSSGLIEISDKIFTLYPKRKKEMSMLIVLLFGYDYVAQGKDAYDFHFSSPCSPEEVASTLRDIDTSLQKLRCEYEPGLI